MNIVPYDLLVEQINKLTRQIETAVNYKKAFYPEQSSEFENRDAAPRVSVVPVKTPKARYSRMPSKLSGIAMIECLGMIEKGSGKDIAAKMFEIYPQYFDHQWEALRLVVGALPRLRNTNKIEKIEVRSPIHGGSIYKLKTN